MSFDFVFIAMTIMGIYYSFREDHRGTRLRGGRRDKLPRNDDTTPNWSSLDAIENIDHILRSGRIPLRHNQQPRLRINKHEEHCRTIFQRLFDREFKSVWPAFLKNPSTNHPLQLDGYCPDIETPIGKGLAFEYDGVQHNQYTPYFHRKGVYEFAYQVEKDRFKTRRCKEEGIALVRIPHYVAFHDLERFIRLKLTQANIRFPQ